MCPFLDDEDDNFEDYQIDNGRTAKSVNSSSLGSSFLRDDKKFFIIGGIASVIAFCAVAYFLYSSSKPIDLEELPIIKADSTPIKIKADSNHQVSHQDKIVYDNISGDKRVQVEERTLPQPEEILSINETDSDASLSDEEKQNIMQAFDDLAPEKEYKINYVKSDGNKQKSTVIENMPQRIKVVEEENPPIKRIVPEEKSNTEKKHRKLGDLVSVEGKRNGSDISITEGSVMVQIASLPTKSSAEVEYKRLANKNKILKNTGKKIFKVDLGKSKGLTYRIQVGPFKNNAEAQKVISALKNNGCSAYISR